MASETCVSGRRRTVNTPGPCTPSSPSLQVCRVKFDGRRVLVDPRENLTSTVNVEDCNGVK